MQESIKILLESGNIPQRYSRMMQFIILFKLLH